MRRCGSCPYKGFGSGPDPLSDICDDCQSDPDTGWGGATDHSVVNDEGHPLHYYSKEEHSRLLDLFDDDEDW